MDKPTEALLVDIAGFLTLITSGVVTVQQPFVASQAQELLEKIGAALGPDQALVNLGVVTADPPLREPGRNYIGKYPDPPFWPTCRFCGALVTDAGHSCAVGQSLSNRPDPSPRGSE